MVLLIVGLVVFFGLHSLSIVSHSTRERLAAKMGEQPFKNVYALLSLAGFVAMVMGYADAREGARVLYFPPMALRHASLLLLLPVFPFLIATYFPGKIKATIKHPMLTATKAWATAHLLSNGALPDVLLFGSFLVWAVANRISMKRRGVPNPAGGPIRNDILAVVVGLGLYVWMIMGLHQWLVGVPPIASMGGGG